MNSPIPPALSAARQSIDNLDAALIHLLAERFRITQQVGQLKADLDLPAADPAREAEQVARLRTLASQSGLDPEFASKVIRFIMTEVVRHHQQLRGRVEGSA
ncbi:MAG: chorismate mutase [Propionibacteriaceae bacterium]|jgi:chorismate mutase|nr:chorismate mutase [Propionibacteriaceae bacterium]